MKHFASGEFWACYRALPAEVRSLADASYERLRNDPRHPALHFKMIGSVWCVRVGAHYRALGTEVDGGILWFWIGTHAKYDQRIG